MIQRIFFTTDMTDFKEQRICIKFCSILTHWRQATEISVFAYGWMEEGVGFVVC